MATGGLTYAGRTAVEDKWMVMHLESKDKAITNFNLTLSEIARILFNVMKFPENGVVLQIDQYTYKQLKIKIKGDYDYRRHLTAEAILIPRTNGTIKILPMKEVRKEKVVKLSRVPTEWSKLEVMNGLTMFGTIEVEPEFINIEVRKEDLDEESLCKNLANI